MGKKILIGLAIVLGAFVVSGLVLPKEMIIEREIAISAPQEKVYDYLRMLDNQNQWGPWNKMDPDMKIETAGTDGEVGYIVKWDGNKDVSAGEQEIVKLTPNDRIDMKLRFKKPMEGEADTWFIVEKTDDQNTKVTWGMYSIAKFPMNIFCYLFNKLTGMMDRTFDQGLADLKTELEK